MSDNIPEPPPAPPDSLVEDERGVLPSPGSTAPTRSTLPFVEDDQDDSSSVASSEKYFSTSDFSVETHRPSPDEALPDDPMDVDPPAPVISDLMHAVNGMFRILDLISESGSGGLVNKIIIRQDSLKAFINELSPGAYSSLTKVDFKTLDQLLIKPVGIYGSKSEIVAFLSAQGAVDELTARDLCLSRDNFDGPSLRSGLYLLRTFRPTPRAGKEQLFVIYWPEDTTWDDNANPAISRNRETFMRYLTKICDQVTCLISEEHAQSIVWSGDSDGAVTTSNSEPSRLFKFKVAKTKEQEEGVTPRPGFEISTALARADQQQLSSTIDPAKLMPKLIGGETRQGLLTTKYMPAGLRETSLDGNYSLPWIRDLLKEGVEFGPNLPDTAIITLMSESSLGLHARYHEAYESWGSRNAAGKDNIDKGFKKDTGDLFTRVINETEQRIDEFRQALADRLSDQFPSLSLSYVSEEERAGLKSRFSNLVQLHPSIAGELEAVIDSQDIHMIGPRKPFRNLKETLTYIGVFLQARPDLTGSRREVAILELLEKRGFPTHLPDTTHARDGKKVLATTISYFTSAAASLISWSKKDQDASIDAETRRLVANTSDAEFLASLSVEESALGAIISEAIAMATDHLNGLIDKSARILVGKAVQIQQEALKMQLKLNKNKALSELSCESLRILRADMEAATPSAAVQITAFDVRRTHYGVSCDVEGIKISTSLAFLDCRIHLLDLTTDDRQMLQLNPTFIPSPHILTNPARFYLDTENRIAHAQLVENSDLLLVLENSTHMSVYLQKPGQMNERLSRGPIRTPIVREKIGGKSIVAYDETTRMLFICAATKLSFHIYGFDESFTTLQPIHVLDLTSWFSPGLSITQACFVPGSEEILVIDSGNVARIYSLVPQQFRPATLALPQAPVCAYSSPDGACLFVSYQGDHGLLFRAYHWNTFGSSQGIDLGPLPVPSSSLVLTSLANRRHVHLVGMDSDLGLCKSLALDITIKATEFMFKEAAVKGPQKTNNTLTHNCLIDCHSDVWTRFPVVAAVQRQIITSSKNRLPRSLTFSSYSDHSNFGPRFDDLIDSFTTQTRKPTGNELKKIYVHAVTIDVVTSFLSADREWAASEFRAGEWLVDLLCLIPIQIAVTKENRFVPLKDGVVSTALEQSLLGADVNKIVDSISIGWYESILRSYMASKPIKVVSSMGEQSVGKSFCLNHLVDTSFAGSAMRTTEGVWMSVAPTENSLILALDFEGVHSIERSAQEDALLVLFNTAISNLVLFRNNFAISRSIAGLFQSFQSSSTVLDPATNPQLFKSTLVIIIKDVVDSDAPEIVREFSTKFQKIVEDEQDANFISRLHAGQLDIIPWPVIESKEFYTLFPALKRTLDQQEVTHPTAGEFLHTLKTLMAKLKANDWGALSETLAAHRAQTLGTYLNRALEFGFYEIEPFNEPLKNLDTDIPIEQPDTSSRFFLSASETTREEQQNIVFALQKSWDRFDARHQILEMEWIAGLAQFLQDRAEMRIEYISRWIDSNLARFKSNHANIDLLRRDFDRGKVDLRGNVEICRMQCASCNLLCLLGRRHEGDIPHDCRTSHICLHSCDFGEEHPQSKSCGYPAGHSGKHICVVGVHLCGEPCMLENKKGCMKKCTKVAKHSDQEHMCDARKHACGEPCSLQHLKLTVDKTYTCPQTCSIPSHDDHDQHVCSTLACPVNCELCMRLCANADHLHGLHPDARHLCGQEHKCFEFCSAPGICQIDTAPQSIEATFTGRHEIFQYTKYSQDSKHLRCAIMIPPNEREHTGRHLHSEDPDPFHFCETRCQNCGYFCTLPFGHPQQEHETSHGSMSQTSWSIDGPDGTILELKGRKFASRDDGAPMMCNLVCQDMGRHVHIDYCRSTGGGPCNGAELEHIHGQMFPNPDRPKDWVSHSLFWKRAGFKDPYSRDDQENFAKCDMMCPGPEHATGNPPAPSYCSLPIFHSPAAGEVYIPPTGQGYISSDGHSFTCKNPAELHPAYHVIFVIDKSFSMSGTDFQPLLNRPGTDLIVQHSNNRLGAVFSSLHAFWVSRSSAFNTGRRGGAGARRDAYSVIFFDDDASVCLRNDAESTPDQLLHSLLGYHASGWTNSAAALSSAETLMQECWSDALAPVVIFLSDGECEDSQENVESLGRTAVDLGKPLSFHTVLFGTEEGRESLDSMAQTALDIQNAAPNNGAQISVPSSFSEALDEVRLAETFLGFAESLRKPRGSLLR
ncbi:hypothetical protein DFH07DRAFT_389440 [Mycena maculata]|uniref:VWFA domain-containing protein n=1 Tax=Mycena maculata TaxID=230809 RepID=A0AAD7KCQ3_9AGAR|nr:hypothetical protein DFH07DRAFT_389440 [Mycena maculata]